MEEKTTTYKLQTDIKIDYQKCVVFTLLPFLLHSCFSHTNSCAVSILSQYSCVFVTESCDRVRCVKEPSCFSCGWHLIQVLETEIDQKL